MPVYFDKKTKTWYCKFNYEDWQGREEAEDEERLPEEKGSQAMGKPFHHGSQI